MPCAPRFVIRHVRHDQDAPSPCRSTLVSRCPLITLGQPSSACRARLTWRSIGVHGHPRGGSRYRFGGAVLEVRVGGVRCAGATGDGGRDGPGDGGLGASARPAVRCPGGAVAEGADVGAAPGRPARCVAHAGEGAERSHQERPNHLTHWDADERETVSSVPARVREIKSRPRERLRLR